MPILTHDQIKKELALGTIKISPAILDEQISVASIDLHLSNEFRVFGKTTEVIDLKETTDYMDITTPVVAEELLVKPHETVLGITKEKITKLNKA